MQWTKHTDTEESHVKNNIKVMINLNSPEVTPKSALAI